MSLVFITALVYMSAKCNKDFNSVKKNSHLRLYKERLLVCRLPTDALIVKYLCCTHIFKETMFSHCTEPKYRFILTSTTSTYLLLYCSLRLRHLVWCLSLYMDCWWHLLLKWSWKRSGSQGDALGLDLHLNLGLSRRFHYLWLLLRNLQCSWKRRHGDIHRLQPPRQLRRRRMQTCCVLHRRAFGRVVLLLALFLSSQLHRLRSGRHSTYKAKRNNPD